MSNISGKTSLLRTLAFSLPWYIYLLLVEAIFVIFKWILPSLCTVEPCQQLQAPGWSAMAWLFSGLVLLLAGMLLATRKKATAGSILRLRNLPKIFSH